MNSKFLQICLSLALFFMGLGTIAAQLSVSFDQVDPTCANYTNGSLVAVPSGGSGPYTYQWSNGSTQNALFSLNTGTYSVSVTDAAGLVATGSATINTPATLSLAIDIAGDACNLTNATLTLNPSGGVGPYTYVWDGVASNGTITNATPGYHYAVVTDANGCTSGQGIAVVDPLSVVVRAQNVVCNAYCDGTVEARIAGGTGPYTFLWSNGATSQIVYGLDPGTYTVVVTDANGCTATDSGTLTEPDAITFTVSLDNQCNPGGSNASVVAQGGTGVLDIRWSTGATGSPVFLPEGQHYVYIRDENGCEVSDRVIVSDGITDVTVMTVDATCDDLGSALLCIVGGRGPFTYIWSNGASVIDPQDLAPGTYTYTIIDGGGCRVDGSLIINGPTPEECDECDIDPGTLADGDTTDELCDDDIVITATRATPATLQAGFQIVYVLTQAPNATILAASATPTFTITPSMGPGAYTIHTLVYDPSTLDLSTIVFGTTTAGEVLLQLTQGGGDICAALDLTGATFTVPECSTQLGCTGGTAAQLASVPVCFDGNAITLTPTITAPATVPADSRIVYILSSVPGDVIIDTSGMIDFDIDAVGTYTIRALVYNPDSLDLSSAIVIGTTSTDDLFASLTECDDLSALGATFDVTLFDPEFGTTAAVPVCAGGSATLNAGGADSLTYSWSPANLLDDATIASPTATVDETTEFTVTISQTVNGNECTVTRTATVTVAGFPSVAAPAAIITCNGGEVDLVADTDTNNTLEWSTDREFGNILSDVGTVTVTSGDEVTYYVRATNPTGCTSIDSVTVGNFPVQVAQGVNETICLGDQAMIDVQVVAGNASTYTFLDDEGNVVATGPDTEAVVSPSDRTVYTLIASNAQGCADTTQLAIRVSSLNIGLNANSNVLQNGIYPGNEVSLDAVSNGAQNFTFITDPTIVSTADSSAVVMPTETTTYTVTGINEQGCVDTASLTIEVLDFVCDRPYLFVPNAFSPDADNVNDVFYVDGVNITETYYAIYNRWGEQVFESRVAGPEDGWDGTFNGTMVDPDVYGLYVRIRCGNGDEFYTQGNVTVIR